MTAFEVDDHHPGAKRPGRNTSGLYLVDHQQEPASDQCRRPGRFEDVFQQLAIRMIRAVENYDPDKGKDLEQHIFAQLQYEVLNCKRRGENCMDQGRALRSAGPDRFPGRPGRNRRSFCGGGLNVKFKTVRRDRLRPVFPNAGRGRSHRTGHSSPFPLNGPRVRAYGLVGPVLQPGRRVRLYRTGKGGSRVKYAAKTLSPVQVGQSRQSPCPSGARKIIVEEVKRTVSSSPQQPKRPIPKELTAL